MLISGDRSGALLEGLFPNPQTHVVYYFLESGDYRKSAAALGLGEFHFSGKAVFRPQTRVFVK